MLDEVEAAERLVDVAVSCLKAAAAMGHGPARHALKVLGADRPSDRQRIADLLADGYRN